MKARYLQKLYTDPQFEIDFINSLKLNFYGQTFKLYPYQEEFIRNIYNNDSVAVLKSRRMGFSLTYALHCAYILYRACEYLDAEEEIYENANFLIVSYSDAMNKHLKEIIKLAATVSNSARFRDTVMKHIKFVNPKSIETALIGYGPEVTEVYFDEYEFFKTIGDIETVLGGRIFKAIGVSSALNGKWLPNSLVIKFLERHGSGKFLLYTAPWFLNPEYAKNLTWHKQDLAIIEMTVDDEDHVAYRPHVWKIMQVDGWEPDSDWKQRMLDMGVSEKELLEEL